MINQTSSSDDETDNETESDNESDNEQFVEICMLIMQYQAFVYVSIEGLIMICFDRYVKNQDYILISFIYFDCYVKNQDCILIYNIKIKA